MIASTPWVPVLFEPWIEWTAGVELSGCASEEVHVHALGVALGHRDGQGPRRADGRLACARQELLGPLVPLAAKLLAVGRCDHAGEHVDAGEAGLDPAAIRARDDREPALGAREVAPLDGVDLGVLGGRVGNVAPPRAVALRVRVVIVPR